MIEHAHGYHHQLFLSLTSISHIFCKYITFMGSFVLISAVLISAFNINLVVLNNVLSTKYPMVLGITYSRSENQEPASFARVRHQLGEITALGLEILVVADIMETLTKLTVEEYSWDTLGKISAIACFRTVLAFMLGREVKEIEEKITEDHDHHEELLEETEEILQTETKILNDNKIILEHHKEE